ncbi:MAG: flippase-like domain-containing protein, partial [Thermoleophilia bacterium]|nr:flippase-like domain-containing protein [Thermoleophilia bacterium]
MAGSSLAPLGVLCPPPALCGERARAAGGGREAADPGSLWLAALAFLGTSLCGALAWRAALRASGSPLPVVDASARYAVGCGLNAVAPAHVGSAVRVALLGRVTNGGCWTVGGAAAAVGATRTVWLGALVAIGSMGGVLPRWPLLVIAAIVGGSILLAYGSQRFALPRRLDQVLVAFRSLASSRRDLAIVAGWAFAGAVAKVVAAAAVGIAFGIDNPLKAALIIVPAVELAAILPLTPGNVGLASAAVALALGSQGVDSQTALSAGIAFGGVELLTGMAIGAAGALALAGPWVRPYVRVAVASAATVVAAIAFGATVVLPAV